MNWFRHERVELILASFEINYLILKRAFNFKLSLLLNYEVFVNFQSFWFKMSKCLIDFGEIFILDVVVFSLNIGKCIRLSYENL